MTAKRTLDATPEIDESTRQSIAACMRGTATGQQAARAMAFILNDLAGIGALEPADLSASEAGFTRGRRWVGIQIARIGKLALWSPQDDD